MRKTYVFTNVIFLAIFKKVKIKGFEWDDGNLAKAQKHGVGIEEIEDFFRREILVLEDPRHSHGERRQIAVGRSKSGRSMFVIFTVRSRGGEEYIRVISARYAHKKEAKIYENLKKES